EPPAVAGGQEGSSYERQLSLGSNRRGGCGGAEIGRTARHATLPAQAPSDSCINKDRRKAQLCSAGNRRGSRVARACGRHLDSRPHSSVDCAERSYARHTHRACCAANSATNRARGRGSNQTSFVAKHSSPTATNCWKQHS